jgi:hypothetical protein
MTTPDSYHDFFTAAAGVAGALVGLLFVAVSVTMERMAELGDTQIHRVRAATALTAFSNALAVSLFALIPDLNLGYTAFVVGVLGMFFVIGALLSMLRLGLRRAGHLRSALFLVGLIGVLVFQLRAGITLVGHSGHHGGYQTIAILVVVCFVIGITRSWELIGGPSIGVVHELFRFGSAHTPGGPASGGGGGAGGGNQSGDGSGSDGGSEPESPVGNGPPGGTSRGASAHAAPASNSRGCDRSSH